MRNYIGSLFLFFPLISRFLSFTPFSQLHANISAILSSYAYCEKKDYDKIVFTGSATGFKLTDVIHDKGKTDIQGYMGVLTSMGSSSDASLYIVFRGSSSIRNWIEDAEIKKVEYTTFPECHCKVHKGFYNSALSIMDQIRNSDTIHNAKSIIVTGHSYGAAVAQLVGMELATKIDPGKIAVYNFGQPRVGDYNYSRFVNNRIPLWRVVHAKDLVPHVPPMDYGFDYYHSCTEIFEDSESNVRKCSDVNCEDPTCGQQYAMRETNVKDHDTYLGVAMTCNLFIYIK
jgi:hypothetical protein